MLFKTNCFAVVIFKLKRRQALIKHLFFFNFKSNFWGCWRFFLHLKVESSQAICGLFAPKAERKPWGNLFLPQDEIIQNIFFVFLSKSVVSIFAEYFYSQKFQQQAIRHHGSLLLCLNHCPTRSQSWFSKAGKWLKNNLCVGGVRDNFEAKLKNNVKWNIDACFDKRQLFLPKKSQNRMNGQHQ